MNRTVIEANNLGKKYTLGDYTFNWRTRQEELWALKDVSFSIKEGEAVGIIGNNGAGKSTLLKILSRITLPSVGFAKVVGKVRTILEVGTGFQGDLTGRENIFLNGALLGMSAKEIRQKFDEIVAFSEIEKFIDTPVKRYSSGMYVRLAFAVAANLNPDILIVDEVLAVGDINFQRKCLQRLEDESSKKGRTIIFVSHNLTALRNFCKRGLLLSGGQLVMDGEINEVVEQFLSHSSQTLELEHRNLKDRLNRTSGKVRFTSINVRNETGDPTWRFKTGENIYLELRYKVYSTVPSLNILIYLRSLDKKILTSFKKTLSEVELKEGFEGVARFCIPNVPLRPGEFGFYICFGDLKGSQNHDVIDEDMLHYLIIQSSEEDVDLQKGYFSIDYNMNLNEGAQ